MPKLTIHPFLKRLLLLLFLLTAGEPCNASTPLIVDKNGNAPRSIYQFPGQAPSQSVSVTFENVGFRKQARSNQCGIVTVTFPTKFKYSNSGVSTRFTSMASPLFPTTLSTSSETSSSISEPVCTGSAYNGTKWASGGGYYYFWRKGSTAKYWRSTLQPNADFVAEIYSFSTYYPLEKKYKANACGVVNISTPYPLYVADNRVIFPTGYILWDGNWNVGGQIVDTNPLWDNPLLENGYICNKGVLYSPR